MSRQIILLDQLHLFQGDFYPQTFELYPTLHKQIHNINVNDLKCLTLK